MTARALSAAPGCGRVIRTARDARAARGGIRADYMKWPDAEPAAFVAGIARRSMLMEKDTHGIFRADRDAA
ncbi:MAG: hypothetical protein NTX90_12115 [Alphaproteobacteria bacterium]|nr:hypothetical protein [Alphaproteobacteria bacterium]